MTGDVSEEAFLSKIYIYIYCWYNQLANLQNIFVAERFDLMKRQGTFFVICIEAEETIVACATLIVEYKFLHSCGQVTLPSSFG